MINYKQYMRSEKWRYKKAQRMQIDDNKCCMCGRDIKHVKSMQVHHVSYKNLGDEDVMKDLCTLCGSCHIKLHNYLNRRKE